MSHRACTAALLLGIQDLIGLSYPTSVPAAPAQAMNFTVDGRITRHEPNRLTLSAQENMIFHVRYGESTEIRRQDGTAGTPQDLRVGIRVRVEGELTESGEIAAHRIKLL